LFIVCLFIVYCLLSQIVYICLSGEEELIARVALEGRQRRRHLGQGLRQHL